MPNLAQIRARIKNQLSYTPIPSQSQGGYLDAVINEAYESIWTSRPYTFNIKEIEKRYWADFTSTGSSAVSLTFTQGSILVEASALLLPATESPVERFVGGYIKGPDEIYYRIENLIINTSTNRHRLILGKPYLGSDAATSTDYTIIQRFHYLPQDTIEIMDVSFPNFPIAHSKRGKVTSIPRRTEVRVSFNEEQSTTARPRWYCPYSKEHLDLVPNSLSSLVNAGVGLDAGTYNFGVSVIDCTGAESGMIDIATVETGTCESITLRLGTGIRVGIAGATDAGSAFQYKVYYALQRPNQTTYKFFHIGTINSQDSEMVTFDNDALRDVKVGNKQDKIWVQSSGSKKIQFFPRPVGIDKGLATIDPLVGGLPAVSYFHLRYLYKPLPLVDDYDVPSLPEEFHHLIIDRALVEIHAKYGNDNASLVSERKFNDRLKKLDARYASERDILLVRSQSQSYGGRFRGMGFPWVPVVTYTG